MAWWTRKEAGGLHTQVQQSRDYRKGLKKCAQAGWIVGEECQEWYVIKECLQEWREKCRRWWVDYRCCRHEAELERAEVKIALVRCFRDRRGQTEMLELADRRPQGKSKERAHADAGGTCKIHPEKSQEHCTTTLPYVPHCTTPPPHLYDRAVISLDIDCCCPSMYVWGYIRGGLLFGCVCSPCPLSSLSLGVCYWYVQGMLSSVNRILKSKQCSSSCCTLAGPLQVY